MKAIADAVSELEVATSVFPPMHSAHEGFAILKEEVDELWEEVKKSPRNRDPEAMRKEAIQVAAMAIRFVRDVCDAATRRCDMCGQSHPTVMTLSNGTRRCLDPFACRDRSSIRNQEILEQVNSGAGIR